MRRKFFRFFALCFLVVFTFVLTGSGFFLWRLKHHPLSLNRFVPALTEKAAQNGGVALAIGDARLIWHKWSDPLRIEISELSASKPGLFSVSVPKITAGFKFLSLLRGRIAPRRMLLSDPDVHVILNKTAAESATAEESDDETTVPQQILHAIERKDGPNRFQIVNARIKITDPANNAEFNIPFFSVTYARHFGRHKLNAEIALQTRDKPVRAVLSGHWLSLSPYIPLTFKTDAINPVKFRGADRYPFLKGWSVPVTLTLSADIDKRPFRRSPKKLDWTRVLKKLSFTLTGTEGDIVLPADIGGAYDVGAFNIAGTWQGRGTPLTLSDISADLRHGGRLHAEFVVENIGKAIAERKPSLLKAVLTAKAGNIAVAQVRDYWPRSCIPGVYDWVVGNVTAGVIPDASVSMSFGDDGTGFGVTNLDISHDIKDVSLTYMDGMPLVTDGNGKIAYSLKDIVIDIDSARSAGLVSRGARVAFVGLDQPLVRFDLSVPLEVADLSDAMKIVLSPGLGLTRQMTQVGPENLSGPATGQLDLTFPLKDDLRPEDVSFTVRAKTDKAGFTGYPFDFISLTDVDADLTVNEKGLTLNALADSGGGEINAALLQDFTGTKEVSTDLIVAGQVTETARRKIGVSFAEAPYLNGTIPARFVLRLFKNGDGEATADADLTPADIAVPPIGWSKKPDIKGSARLKMLFAGGKPSSIPDISVSDATGNKIKTAISFAPDGKIKRIDVPFLITGKTDLKTRIRFDVKGKNRIDITGPTLDLTMLTKKEDIVPETEKSADPKPESPDEKKEADETTYVINAAFDKILLSDSAVENSAFSAVLKGGEPQRIDATGQTGEDRTPFRFKFYPDPKNNESSFVFTSEDVGSLMKLAGSSSTVKGGKLKIKGRLNVEKGAYGLLEIENFRLKGQPLLTRLLRLTSFTGLIDTFTGKGLHFKKAEVQFSYKDGDVSLENGLVAGSSLGITVEGSYGKAKNFVNLTGTMMPFYGVNGLVGKVPVVGKVLTGEKGGGLIGVSYKIKGALTSPEISVNPLSAVAPGIFRKIMPNFF